MTNKNLGTSASGQCKNHKRHRQSSAIFALHYTSLEQKSESNAHLSLDQLAFTVGGTIQL